MLRSLASGSTDKNGKTIDTIKVIGVKDNMKDSDIATVKVADLKTQKPTIVSIVFPFLSVAGIGPVYLVPFFLLGVDPSVV